MYSGLVTNWCPLLASVSPPAREPYRLLLGGQKDDILGHRSSVFLTVTSVVDISHFISWPPIRVVAVDIKDGEGESGAPAQ